jgi:asparagine synthase (glutamine-hydrolysing)
MRVDAGPDVKATLAGWGIDVRDPSCDRDLFDHVAALPPHLFRHGGVPRSMIRAAAVGWAAPEVLGEARRGYQAADWYEGATAHRGWLAEQIAAVRDFPEADRLIDGDRLAGLVAAWPTSGWHDRATIEAYRTALLRGVSMGHFMRRASGSNR